MPLVLTQYWHAGTTDRDANPDARRGRITFTIHNTGQAPVTITRLCYASMTRPGAAFEVSGARLEAQTANHIALVPDGGTRTIPPQGTWSLTLAGFTHPPQNRSQGAMAAWVETPDANPRPIRCEDLRADAPRGPRKTWPEGSLSQPLALLPWPTDVDIAGFSAVATFKPGPGMDLTAFEAVASLHQRLFPDAPDALSFAEGRPVTAQDAQMPKGAYRLHFTRTNVTLTHGDADGLRHGLTSLAQMAHGALNDPRCRLPLTGTIADHPRFGWRGCHIDVARNFRPIHEVTRLADILAWHKMNQLHLHLTDDEAWRLESAAFPDLTRIGARRGLTGPLPPQYADGPAGQCGHYTQAQMRALVAHASALGLTITPEIDLPGHAFALINALPDLRDPGEPRDSYRSFQGYENNAINPGLARSYEVIETLLDELCEIFPGPVVHLGGDEVSAASWQDSPAAAAMAKAERLPAGAAPLQAAFLRRLQDMLRARGKRMGGWDECADGGGVDRADALLFAWRSAEKTAELLAQGYSVVSTPGEAYYLDMIQAEGWDEPGTSWAGAVSVETTYRFEPTDGLPEGAALAGIQACIWAEHLNTREKLNYMTFPRLSAVAEAAWTPPAQKDFARFAAISHLMPQV